MTTRIIAGDCRDVLPTLAAESVHMVVTSPPYWGLRDYQCEGQIGLERTSAEYVAELLAVFREVRRVLRSDGTVWLNLGDCYGSVSAGLPQKNLVGIPWRVAFALQDDGWWLRSAIVWHKPNSMPESCRDRPTSSYEMVYLLTKRATYFYDQDAVRENHTAEPRSPGGYQPEKAVGPQDRSGSSQWERHRTREESYHPGGRNMRNVWTIATTPFREAHFATFPPELVERCIKAGTSELGCCPDCGAPWRRVIRTEKHPGSSPSRNDAASFRNNGNGDRPDSQDGRFHTSRDTIGWQPTCDCQESAPIPATILDPFSGAGTTALVADRLGRNCIGIDLRQQYHVMARNRVIGDCPLFAEVSA